MTIICGKCEKEMKEIELKGYEFEEGIILDNIRTMQCSSGHVTFTEEQADVLEQRTEVDPVQKKYGLKRTHRKER